MNIKTPATLKNHSEYWTNMDQVQGPFAQRVLGDLMPAAWTFKKLESPPWPLNHHQWVMLLSIVCAALWLVPLGGLLLRLLPWAAFMGPAAVTTVKVVQNLLHPLQPLKD